jgi:hypothetical protein
MPARIKFHADTRHGGHPNLAARKALAARVLIARNLRLRVSLCNIGNPVLEDLVREAQHHVETEASYDGASLGEFLAGMLEAVDRRLKLLAARNPKVKIPSAKLSEMLDLLREEAGKVSCEFCAGFQSATKCCTGHALDSDIVAGGARCLGFITELFDFLVDLAAQHYAPLLPDAPTRELKVRLKTRHHSKTQLGAATKFSEDAPNNRHAEVVLDLPLQALDDTHLKRLPYTMFHEIFVHAPESWEAQARRTETSERCAFREGFVDAAALFVLLSALKRGKKIPISHRDFIRLYQSESKAAHRERRSYGPNGRMSALNGAIQASVPTTRDAGANVFDVLEQKGLANDAVRIAICLNRLALTEEERTRVLMGLVEIADSLCPINGMGEPGAVRWLDLLGRLREAAHEGNANIMHALLNEMVDPEEF